MGEKVITSNDTILVRSRGIRTAPLSEGSGLVHNHQIPWQEKPMGQPKPVRELADGLYAVQRLIDLNNSLAILQENGASRKQLAAARVSLRNAAAHTVNGGEILRSIQEKARIAALEKEARELSSQK